MEPVLEIARAIRLVREWAASRQIRIAERANYDLQTLGFDADDAMDLLERVQPGWVRNAEPDRDRPGRTILVMQIRLGELRLYVKISLRLDVEHDVALVSFHRWGQ